MMSWDDHIQVPIWSKLSLIITNICRIGPWGLIAEHCNCFFFLEIQFVEMIGDYNLVCYHPLCNLPLFLDNISYLSLIKYLLFALSLPVHRHKDVSFALICIWACADTDTKIYVICINLHMGKFAQNHSSLMYCFECTRLVSRSQCCFPTFACLPPQ